MQSVLKLSFRNRLFESYIHVSLNLTYTSVCILHTRLFVSYIHVSLYLTNTSVYILHTRQFESYIHVSLYLTYSREPNKSIYSIDLRVFHVY